jgi:hypothetical protein
MLGISLSIAFILLFGGGWLILVDAAAYANRMDMKIIKGLRRLEESGKYIYCI